jgi:multidrug resistance efflux pump
VNSLDPLAKRFRVADRSIQQARNALNGAVLSLSDIPRSNQSPLTAALESIAAAMEDLDSAAAQLDEARLVGHESDPD